MCLEGDRSVRSCSEGASKTHSKSIFWGGCHVQYPGHNGMERSVPRAPPRKAIQQQEVVQVGQFSVAPLPSSTCQTGTLFRRWPQ